METSNMDDSRFKEDNICGQKSFLDRKTIMKSCSMEYEETQCKHSGFGNKLITRCTCETNFCNEEKNLYALGLQTHSSSNKIFLKIQIFLIIISIILIIDKI